MMNAKKTMGWRCLNYGACKKADSSEPVEIAVGADFHCPECGGSDGIRMKGKRPNFPLYGLVAGGIALSVVIVMLLSGGKGGPVVHRRGGGEGPRPVIIEPLKYPNGIDRKVLARPDAVLYKEQDGDAAADPKPNNFEQFYVYGDDPQSKRLRVGRTNVAEDGWLARDDAMEWPHSIIVSFEETENRNPVLFFREDEPLRQLLENPAGRTAAVAGHYRTIADHVDRGEVLPADYPVVCIEPKHHDNQPLIMPVLEARILETPVSGGRMLKVAAAGETRGATDFRSERYVKLLRELREAEERRRLSEIRIDVDLVFVIDMTGTMQPWIDGLFGALKGIVAELDGSTKNGSGIRFGLWGYQDKDELSGIQFRTRDFTPELQDAANFRNLLETIKVNRMTPDSYPEDVFAGVTDAISKTSWRKNAQKVIVLIGDAPGHTTQKNGAREDFDAAQVRQLANDARIQIASIAIKDSSKPEYLPYHPKLEEQFTHLASNPGLNAPSYLSLDQTGTDGFRDRMEDLLEVFLKQPVPSDTPGSEPVSDAGKIALGILQSARARVVSAEVNEAGESVMPRDINGWIYEMDLIDPSIRSLEPKLLVTRSELNTLVGLTDHVVSQLEEAAILGKDFYDQLLDAVAGAASGGRSSGEGVQLPTFLQGLPYKSEVMSRSAEWFRALDTAGQQQFISSIKAKLNYYRRINETPSLWRSLNSNALSDDQVAEIPLSQLP